MKTVFGTDQLRGNAYAIALLSYRSLENVRDAQRLADRLQICIFSLEGKRRGAPGNFQSVDPGERVENFLGHAIGEVLLVLAGAHIRKGQHGN